jgi:hypothetical protein
MIKMDLKEISLEGTDWFSGESCQHSNKPSDFLKKQGIS